MPRISFLNGFTCNARAPSHWRTGTLCLLVETNQGLVLVDTGLGQDDYVHRPGIVRIFQALTVVPLDPQEAIVRQVAHLGYEPHDVRHIILTHMHFDHCGGLPDFPKATVHVHRREYESFMGHPWHWTDLAYVRRHIAHRPQFALYDDAKERWFDWPAIRLPFEPQIWLVPLFGHSCGHCGVAIQDESVWHFHVGDAAPVNLEDYAPRWIVRSVLGPLAPRLRGFQASHPDICLTTGHMWLDSFQALRG